MPEPYCSLAELKQHLNISTTKYDAWLEVLIEEACDAINAYTNHPDGLKANGQADAREFSGSGNAVLWIDECARIEKVEVKDSPTDDTYVEWSSSDWYAGRGDPRRRPILGDREFQPYTWIATKPGGLWAIFISGRFTSLRGFPPDLDTEADQPRAVPTVRVTANWGYSMSTPPRAKLAAMKLIGLAWQRGKSGESDESVSPDLGITTFRRRTISNLDKDTEFLLQQGRLIRPVF